MEHPGSLGIGERGDFRIHFDRELAHPVERVWSALTDPAKLSVWMQGCTIEASVGGRAYFDFGDEGAAHGSVTVVLPPGPAGSAELRHTWNWNGLPESLVTWQLEPIPGGTRLTLTHGELVDAAAADFASGWHVILDTLGRHLGDRPLDDVWEDYPAISAHYAKQAAAAR